MTSDGRVAVFDGIFSASAAQASTATGSFNSAIASSAPITDAAPVISPFISSILRAGLSAIPPESNVIPLPTYAKLRLAFDGLYERETKRGGFAEP